MKTFNTATKLAGLLLCMFIAISATSQTKVEAQKIMNDIKNGKDIVYKNVTIVGNLDFTYMDQKLEKLPRRRKNSWWNFSKNSNEVKELISNKVSFVNCVFEGNVFAYIHDEYTGYTFTASFDDDAIFTNCTFKEKSMFKYSHFDEKADFSGSSFNDESTFKYAVFNDYVSFASSVFKETATFKYTKFKDGVSFNKTRFEEDLNIKYTKVHGKFDITGMYVAYDVNSKYTRINGKKFNYN